jgi:hypothetical protein
VPDKEKSVDAKNLMQQAADSLVGKKVTHRDYGPEVLTVESVKIERSTCYLWTRREDGRRIYDIAENFFEHRGA